MSVQFEVTLSRPEWLATRPWLALTSDSWRQEGDAWCREWASCQLLLETLELDSGELSGSYLGDDLSMVAAEELLAEARRLAPAPLPAPP